MQHWRVYVGRCQGQPQSARVKCVALQAQEKAKVRQPCLVTCPALEAALRPHMRTVWCPQEFPHPQARFLHEKRFQLSSKWEGRMAPLLRGINRESYTGVFNAMFMGVVRHDLQLSLSLSPCCRAICGCRGWRGFVK